MNTSITDKIEQINCYIGNHSYGSKPEELYEPIDYIMGIGGKRIRPLLCLLAYNLYRHDWETILDQAAAIEVFHNFTLMHDDIMDNAPIRRGQPTVHNKWNNNIAILSGDVMLIKAYELLLKARSEYLPTLLKLFNDCAAGVCEGQQFDMDFEERQSVNEAEYINMIRLKTAVLLGFSLETGGLLAGATMDDQVNLRNFGETVGIGFQLKDDILDVYGDAEKFGKQEGGDIISNKKTYLLIKALELAEGDTNKELLYWIQAKDFNPAEKVKAVKEIYNYLNIRKISEDRMKSFFQEAFRAFDLIHVDANRKEELKVFTQWLIDREN